MGILSKINALLGCLYKQPCKLLIPLLFPILSLAQGGGIPATVQQNPVTAAETAASATICYLNQPALNVLRYCADPLGINDSAAAFNTAVAVAKISGGTIVVPSGTFKINSNISIGDSVQGVFIQGNGVLNTQIVPGASVTTLFQFGASGSQSMGVSNVYINAANATGETCIAVASVEYFYLDSVNTSQCNVALSISGGGAVQYYTRWNFNRNGADGVLINSTGNDFYFDNGTMSNVGYTQPSGAGFNIQYGSGIWITNSDIISQGNGILVDPGNSQFCTWLFAVNDAFDTNTTAGINLQPTGTGYIRGADFTASWAATNLYGVFFGGTGTIDATRFNGIRVFNNSQHGIVLTNGTNTHISGSDVSGNSLSSPGTYHGITISPGVSSFDIQGNSVGAEAGFSTTQGYGILVNAGASNNYTITNNNLQGNNTALSDGGTGVNKNVSNNLGVNFPKFAYATIVQGASSCTLANSQFGISGCTFTSTGVSNVVFTTPFATTPVCSTGLGTGGSTAQVVTSASTTYVNVLAYNSGTAANELVNLVCLGV